jgi:PAS domain S-box-containing protein
VIQITETFQTRQVCSRRLDSGGTTIGAHHRKEGKPMENAEAIHVQPNSHTTTGPAAACSFSGCIMPVMASSGQGSERLNAQLLVDSIPALIHTARPDGYLDYFNKPWLEYLGVTLDKVTGWNWTAYVHPDDVEGISAKWRACLATGEVFEYETRVRSANGEYRWMFHRKVPLRDANGNIVKWYGSSLDIEERKTAEEQLRCNAEELQRSEFYLAEGQRLAHMGSWAFDPDGFYYWSPELFRMHGLDPASKPPSVQEYLDRVHSHDRESMADLIKGILATASPFDATKRIVRPNGEVRYIRCVGVPLADNQSLKKYVGSTIDVTEHELLTQELRRREAYLTEAQKLSHTGSFGWKPGTGEIVWSDETYRIFEYDRSVKPTIDSVVRRVHPQDRADFQKVIDGASWGATDFEHAYRLLLPDGRVKHVHAKANVLQDASGNREFVGAVTDITERKTAEEALRSSEAYLAEAQRLSHTGSWAWSPDQDIRYWSEECYRVLSFDPQDGLPRFEDFFQRLHADDQPGFRELIETAIREKAEWQADYRIVHPDGPVRDIHVVGHPVLSASGHLVEFVGTVIDVTERKRAEEERKRAEEALRRSEAYLAEAQRLSHTGSWAWSPDTDVRYWSEECYRVLGFDPRDGAPRMEGLIQRIHPDDQSAFRESAKRARHSIFDEEVDYRIVHPGGAVKDIHSIGHPVFSPSGDLIEFTGTVIDVTERKRAEEELRRSEMELRQLLDFTPQLVSVFGSNRERLYANRVVLDYLGIGLDEWRQRSAGIHIHPDDSGRVKACWDRALGSGSGYDVELRLRKHDGSYRWFLARYNPVRDEQGQITRWYVAATDIEDRKQAEDRLRSENVALREEIDKASMFEEIVGTSPALKCVLSRISKVAPTDSTVLITGETGTGKELVARAIHRRSDRVSRPFVSVNCAAIPRDLVASELFGHEKGAFTGATQQRLGRFELANGGTIFLDEVGELPAETQIALLRVLQEHEFERVGGTRRIHADVRVIAATNRDLQAAISAGSFRSDLFYRLHVFPIEMPSLRERRADIPLLVEYFIDRYARKAGKNIKRVNKKTLELLQSYPWPGNIRELQNVIERSVILCETEIFSIDESWLPKHPSLTEPKNQMELPGTLLAQEKDMIEAALKASRGRIFGPTGAAAKLGIPRSTLESKIKSLKIDKNHFRTLSEI